MEFVRNKKKSVVQIIDRLNIGGTERVLVTISNLLMERGHDVSVITTVNKGPLAGMLHKNIPIIDLKRKWKWNPVTMYRLIKAIRKFDIIHVHSSYNLRYLFLAAKMFRLKKTIFFHEHFGDININQSVSWHTKFIYPKTIIIAVSNQIAAWAIQKLEIPKERVFVLANTIIKKNYSPVPPKKKGIKNLLLVSNIRPTKNIVASLEILKQLLGKSPDFYLTIIGQIADEKYYNELVAYINIHHLQNAVEIRINETDIQSVLSEFDLALHTSLSESGPLVLIEYLAQGLPFITYETGEVVRQIKQDVPELIMQDFDVDEWVKRVETILQKDKKVLQDQLQNLFEKYYSADAYYEACMHIYNTGLSAES